MLGLTFVKYPFFKLARLDSDRGENIPSVPNLTSIGIDANAERDLNDEERANVDLA